tara:strand:+ start:496 stop:639 length:144 start_codon:yes stop_codon:yes gene_type:complete
MSLKITHEYLLLVDFIEVLDLYKQKLSTLGFLGEKKGWQSHPFSFSV